MIKVLFFLVFTISACNGIQSGAAWSPPWERCGDAQFEHKTETEIAAMSPEEKMDQMVLEQMFHVPFSGDDNYKLLHDHLVQDGLKILPKAIEYANAYDPKASECRDRANARLLTAAMYLHLVDFVKIRLRGVESGRNAIDALEQAIVRKSKEDIENQKGSSSRTNLLTTLLNQIRGGGIIGDEIQQALRDRYNIHLSDNEMLQLSNFLISLDPSYPSWRSFGRDEMSPSESEKFYNAYLKFKSKAELP